MNDMRYFGGLLAASAMARGNRAALLDSGARNSGDLRKTESTGWSAAIFAQGTVKETVGSFTVPVAYAGDLVKTGDIILADDDGVCVAPNADAERFFVKAQAHLDAQDAKGACFAASEPGREIHDMRGRPKAESLTYE